MAVRGLPREPGWRFVCTVHTRSVEQLGGEDDGQGGNQEAWFGPEGLHAGAGVGRLECSLNSMLEVHDESSDAVPVDCRVGWV